MNPAIPIAVIGAGLAGLACARNLLRHGRQVRLFDKGRTAGGRLATRRADAAGAALQWDHGAQYLTARGREFTALLASLGAVPWTDPHRYVGTPGMSALPRRMAEGLDLATGCHVTGLSGGPGAWMVHHLPARLVRPGAPLPAEPPVTEGPFAAVAVALPAPQAAPLLGPVAPTLSERLLAVRLSPCWTAMAAFPKLLPLPDTLRPGEELPAESPVGWAARDSSKPGRSPATECWVLQATPTWSREHLEDTPDMVATALLQALEERAGASLGQPLHASAHRWRYALVEVPLGTPALWDPALLVGAAGDWCIEARAEAAFLSGTLLAETILRA